MLNAMLNVANNPYMLSVTMLNVVRINAVMLRVVAPCALARVTKKKAL
jgi:DUF971 family protein